MLKYVVGFIAGCVTVIAVIALYAAGSFHRMTIAAVTKTGTPTVTVSIRVTQDLDQLRPAKEASAVLDQITNLTDAERKKIRDGIASGLVTDIELRRESGGESQSITIPVRPGGVITRMSSSAHFGPQKLLSPTVTPAAGQPGK